ncbi:RidA family protein [Rufibacter latericius]|uniref:RidA family protein n=1 Tax=Rufibacter latericius TaxID=2487040 RepID=A0A3M9MKV9_9BACT|nr:RidA family protein [Rufibacter latericius]RNI25857.1 RidA family protein [Rufibacter latericius]
MTKFAFTLLLILLAYTSKAQTTPTSTQMPKVLRPNQEWNYAQAYRSANMLYISGTVASGPMDQAIDKVYRTLQATLKQYNLDFTHVVKENLYTTNMEETSKHHLVRKKYYGTHTPAATWVQVVRLLEPNVVLEVELIAEIQKTE